MSGAEMKRTGFAEEGLSVALARVPRKPEIMARENERETGTVTERYQLEWGRKV